MAISNGAILPILARQRRPISSGANTWGLCNSLYSDRNNYSRLSNGDFAENSYQYNSSQYSGKMQQFYFILVNEISDMWVTMWKDAGKDLSGLPPDRFILRSVKVEQIDNKPANNILNTSNANVSSEAVYTDRELSKYSSKPMFEGVQTYSDGNDTSIGSVSSMPDASTRNSRIMNWDDCERKVPSDAKQSKLRAGVEFYNNFMALCTSGISADVWDECDRKSAGHKHSQLKAGRDLYVDSMSICTKSERPSRRETTHSIIDQQPKTINPGARNITTGEFYPGTAGGIINPRTGQVYPDVGPGYINPKNGQFMPKQ